MPCPVMQNPVFTHTSNYNILVCQVLNQADTSAFHSLCTLTECANQNKSLYLYVLRHEDSYKYYIIWWLLRNFKNFLTLTHRSIKYCKT